MCGGKLYIYIGIYTYRNIFIYDKTDYHIKCPVSNTNSNMNEKTTCEILTFDKEKGSPATYDLYIFIKHI